jgi:hypothetical protein
MTYAKGTSVSVSSSQQEIGRVLTRYEIDTYRFGQEPGWAVLEFFMAGFPVRIGVPIPPAPTEDKVYNGRTGRWVQTRPKWEQDVKERWRGLVLLLKANLEAVEMGLVSVEQAFMPFLVLKDGRTLGDVALPTIREQVKELIA